MKLKYEPVYSLETAMRVFEAQSRDKSENHFVEGIMFSLDLGVVMTGKLVDTANNVSWNNMFYKLLKLNMVEFHGQWYYLNSFEGLKKTIILIKESKSLETTNMRFIWNWP